MSKKCISNKAITLIALVITIVVLLIIAAVVLNLTLGDNGIIKRAKDAALMNKKAQYIEEIQMEIVDENLERLQYPKEELFIVSLQKRLQGSEVASQENVKVYTKKVWIDKTEINLRTLLVVYTVDDYEILIDVDNENNTATIRDSLIKKGKECTISFNGNTAIGGSTNSKTTSEGLYIELPENGFTKTNYTFVGWYKNPECTGDRYNPSEAYQVLGDETLYAKWSQSAITITYNPGFETEDTMSNSTIEVGATDNLLDNAFSRLGYTFAGWKDQYDDTYIYENHQEITAEKDLTLTAQWTPINYTIEYDLDGGVAENPATYTIETPTFTLTNPTSSDGTFLGWSGTNLTGDDNTEVIILQGSTENRSYTAHWDTSTFKITYNLNGGNLQSGVTNPASYTTESATITLNNPVKSGYTFIGWTGSNGTIAQTTVTIPSGSTEAKNYTANWKQNANFQTMYGYTSSSTIPWNTFKSILDNGLFDTSIVGAQVTDSNNHNWRIIKAENGYYDLWYQATIGSYRWHSINTHNASQGTGKWSNCELRANLNGNTFYNNTSYLPATLKTYVITKPVVASVYWCGDYVVSKSDDYVWILTQTELNMGTSYVNVGYDGSVYSYFTSTTRKIPNCSYWTASSLVDGYGTNWNAGYAGTSESNAWGSTVTNSKAVVPAVRVR